MMAIGSEAHLETLSGLKVNAVSTNETGNGNMIEVSCQMLVSESSKTLVLFMPPI